MSSFSSRSFARCFLRALRSCFDIDGVEVPDCTFGVLVDAIAGDEAAFADDLLSATATGAGGAGAGAGDADASAVAAGAAGFFFFFLDFTQRVRRMLKRHTG